jgi:hypothetical protein
MKVTPKLLFQLSEMLERMGGELGRDMPAAATMFSWMCSEVAIEIEDEARKFRIATFRQGNLK